MTDTVVVRRFAPHEWPIYRDLRLRALADAPDAFSRTLAEEAPRPDAEWRQRVELAAQSATDLPLVALVDGDPAALAWARVRAADPSVVDVYQVWVAPEQRGRGIGRRLLDAIVAWAREAGAQGVVLDVTRGDGAATRMYRAAGFRPTSDPPQPLRAGSPLTTERLRLPLGDDGAPA